MPVEQHPLEPFLPENGRLLMLGSFPPQQKRWAMSFYYPNFTNDMWRVLGLVFHGDPLHFVDVPAKSYRKDAIVAFLQRVGIGIFDTASAVRRLQDNASDKFLEVVTPTDVEALLARMPACRAIVTTGQKAADTLCERFGIAQPPMGGFTAFCLSGQSFRLYRMPSTSRAYPLALAKKAAAYRVMFEDLGMV
ncbi:MAG: uracil-DNA glycosylase family protein [Bacteroidaceae bacterium]|nr:uracil-DNA glycosylase family protein [Bacteroidaceae bacterium]